MTTPADEQAQLAARNAKLREKVDQLMGDFDRRTAQLNAARQAAAALSATLRSPDGTVTVQVDSTGMLTDLRMAPTTFDHTRPDTLARTISDLVRRATIQVRRQTAELMRPITEGLPDLSDLVDGAPSLSDLVPKIPTYPPPEPAATIGPPPPSASPIPSGAPVPSVAPRRPRQPTPVEDAHDAPTSWMEDVDV